MTLGGVAYMNKSRITGKVEEKVDEKVEEKKNEMLEGMF